MARPSDISVLRAEFKTAPLPYRAPLKFGGRIVAGAEILNVRIEVESCGGGRATGFGSMPLGNVWAWPSAKLEPDVTAKAIRTLSERITTAAGTWPGYAHPLDIVAELHGQYARLARDVEQDLELAEP